MLNTRCALVYVVQTCALPISSPDPAQALVDDSQRLRSAENVPAEWLSLPCERASPHLSTERDSTGYQKTRLFPCLVVVRLSDSATTKYSACCAAVYAN